jgi:hypothetical protein
VEEEGVAGPPPPVTSEINPLKSSITRLHRRRERWRRSGKWKIGSEFESFNDTTQQTVFKIAKINN